MLGSTSKQIYQELAFEPDNLFNLYIMVCVKGIALDEPIDDDDNTLLHKLAESGTLQEVREYLEDYKPKNMNPFNKKGETPLQVAINNRRPLIASQLRKMGAQPNAATTALSEEFKKQALVILKIQKTSAQFSNFHLFDLYLNLMHICQENSFDLNAPFDEHGNRLLQLLIQNKFNAYIIDIFLRNNRNIDIHCRNNQGKTPMMMATALGNAHVIACLAKHGAKSYTKYPSPPPTVYDDLMAYVDANLSVPNDNEKPWYIFGLFMRYIIQKNWKYDPDNSQYCRDVVDKPAYQSYTMNCVGLSQALFVLFHAQGFSCINKVKLYPSVKGGKILLRPVNQSHPGVTGIFQCFDLQANEKMVGKNSIRFVRHDFLQSSRDQKCFDPTFNCTYDNINAPVINHSAVALITPYQQLLAERIKQQPRAAMPALERKFAKCAI